MENQGKKTMLSYLIQKLNVLFLKIINSYLLSIKQ